MIFKKINWFVKILLFSLLIVIFTICVDVVIAFKINSNVLQIKNILKPLYRYVERWIMYTVILLIYRIIIYTLKR
jgi:hypothetical protein